MKSKKKILKKTVYVLFDDNIFQVLYSDKIFFKKLDVNTLHGQQNFSQRVPTMITEPKQNIHAVVTY